MHEFSVKSYRIRQEILMTSTYFCTDKVYYLNFKF